MTRRRLLAALMSLREPRRLCGGFVFTEGPACAANGDLYFSDVGAERIYCRSQDGVLRVVRNSSNVANGLAFDARGRLLVCERGRLTRTDADGRITILADTFEDKGLNDPNDLAVRSDGTIFFSDLRSKTAWANPAKTDFSALYQLSPNGVLAVVSRALATPNGVALSPDEKRLYVADTAAGEIRLLPSGELFARVASPDGLKTDSFGNVWACAAPGLVVFDSRGALLRTIPLPESPSSCAFSRDGRALYVTARTSVYEISL
jgi:gluconolactonase